MSKGLPRVVIVGGGVAALEVMLGLRKLATGLVELDMICPQREFVYKPLSVTEPFKLGSAPRFDLGRICDEHGVRHVLDRVTDFDTHAAVLHTGLGDELGYDAAVIAVGAHPQAAIPDAITFTGPDSREPMNEMLAEIERGEVHRIAFVVPPGAVWGLPAYELALMTSERVASRGIKKVNIALITSEQAPLRLFGRQSSDDVARLLARHNIELHVSARIAERHGDNLTLMPVGSVAAERIVAMPTLSGPRLRGLSHDADGFLRTDGYGLVEDTTNVYAAGDITSFPVKQGGIATQQADSIVTKLAARFGADVEPRPFRPVLRGLLLSDEGPHFLRAEIAGGAGDESEISRDPLWWPAGKIMGRYLSPYLAGLGATATGHPGRS
jgi:sulfide:quinone oxidoreductase